MKEQFVLLEDRLEDLEFTLLALVEELQLESDDSVGLNSQIPN